MLTNMKHVIWILLLSSAAHAQQKMYYHKSPKQDKDDPEVYHVSRNIELTYAGVHTYGGLEYMNQKDIAARIKKDAELKMLSKEQVDQQLSEIPEGGYIYFICKRSTIEEAKLSHFTVVVKDKSDQEILRGSLRGDNIPEYISSNPGYYFNMGSINVPEPFTEEVRVYVIDDLKQIRHEYLIKPL